MRIPIQFRLRSLFLLLAIVAVVSEFSRWAIGGHESPFSVGLACFVYGGIAGLLTYASVATMWVVASRSPTAQRIGIIISSALSTIVWLLIVIVPTISWIPVCGLYSALVVTLMAFLTRSELASDDSISPEHTLQRLQRAKAEVSSNLDKTSTTDRRPTAHAR